MLPLAAPAVAQGTRTLRFIPQSNLAVLDPMFSSEVVTNHGYYVFDTLYSLDSAGIPRPQMAAAHEVSSDGLVWRIKLRDGLRFHNGEPVRAIDCALSLQRWSRLDSFGKLLAKAVATWEAADDNTVEIRLTRPFPLFLHAIGKSQSQVAFVLPEHLARTDPAKQIPEVIGSGPYRFLPRDYISGSQVAYERFDGYQPRPEQPDWASGAKIAHFPRIEWHIIPDAATSSAALQSGEVDWWETPLPDLYPALRADRNIVLQADNPLGRTSFMVPNHLQPPFDDVRVRRALLAAVNQEDYMRATQGDDPGLWRVCRSQFPCGTLYEADDGGRLMQGDAAAGRRLLKEAGYAGQKAVVLNPTDNAMVTPQCEVTADLLRQIGMSVELATSDWGTVVQRRTSKAPVEKGGWSLLHTYGFATSYANPAVNPILRGAGSENWFGWWNSERAQALVQDWLDAPGEAERSRAGLDLGRLAMEEVPMIPLGQWFGRTAYRRGITGVRPGGAPYPWNVRPA